MAEDTELPGAGESLRSCNQGPEMHAAPGGGVGLVQLPEEPPDVAGGGQGTANGGGPYGMAAGPQQDNSFGPNAWFDPLDRVDDIFEGASECKSFQSNR